MAVEYTAYAGRRPAHAGGMAVQYTAYAGRRPAYPGGMAVQCEFATRLTPHVRAGGPRTQAEWLCNVSSLPAHCICGPEARAPRSVYRLCRPEARAPRSVYCPCGPEARVLRSVHHICGPEARAPRSVYRSCGPEARTPGRTLKTSCHWPENLDEHEISSYTTRNTHREENP
jgi:hypothetical protein